MKKILILLILLSSASSFGNVYGEYEDGCDWYTSNDKLKEVCLNNKLPSYTSQACQDNARGLESEKECLENGNSLKTVVIRWCSIFTSSEEAQVVCLRFGKNMTLSKVKDCQKNEENLNKLEVCYTTKEKSHDNKSFRSDQKRLDKSPAHL